MTIPMGVADDETDIRELLFDPFAYIPEMSSAVVGIHGNDQPSDPLYVFHSVYSDAFSGLVEIELAFTDLSSRNDRLYLAVHSLDRVGDRLEVVATTDISLRSVAANGGKATMMFDALPHLAYAILGRTRVPSKARATAMSLRCRIHPERTTNSVVAPASARLSAADMRPVAALVAMTIPTFAQPVSQSWTRAQVAEPAYARACKLVGLLGPVNTRQWCVAYIYQVFERFGVLANEAVGVGFGTDTDLIGGIIANSGEASVETIPRLASPRGLKVATTVSPAVVEGSLSIEMIALPPVSKLASFDFLWSTSLCDSLPSTTDVTHFVEDSLEYLKPGGMAVHMLVSTLGCPVDSVDHRASFFSQNELGQLALAVVAGKNEIAQLNLVTDPDDRQAKPYGIIVRKAP